MKNKIIYPPEISLDISDNFLQYLNQNLGDCNSELQPWISISLIHPTYLNEKRMNLVKRSTLDALSSLGASFIRLILFDIAHEDSSLTQLGDYSRFVHNIHVELMQKMFYEFGLDKIALIGKGEKGKISPKVSLTIVKQFFGALILCYGYDSLKPVVYQLSQNMNLGKEVLDYKTVLQEYCQSKRSGPAQYELIEESGPDHQKEFIIQVSTTDGKVARAKGRSKHDASKNAALAYIKQFAPTLLVNKNSQSPKIIVKNSPSPIFAHKNFVLSICKIFNVEQGKAGVFSQSLTHTSFVNEVFNHQGVDYRKHAQLGANVLESLFTLQISLLALDNLSIDKITIEQYRSLLSNEDYSQEGFDLLNLQDGVLLGTGEKQIFHKDISSKADFFQAVIGAAFKNHGTWKKFFNNIPQIFEGWLTNKLQAIQEMGVYSDVDPVGGLITLCHAIRLNYEYRYSISGPGHQVEYKPQLLLQSESTSETFLLKSKIKFASKKLAARHISSVALKAINIINSEFGTNTKTPYEDSKELIQFSKFLLFHELSTLLSNTDIIRWQKLGILGSQFLTQGKLYEFKLWAITAGNSIQDRNIAKNAFDIYSSIPQISEKDQDEYKSTIGSIGSFIEKLSPEGENSDIRLSVEFDNIVKLSKIFKLLSQKWGATNLQQVADDLLLLRRGRFPELQFESKIPDILISEKEGTYQTIFLNILELVENLDSKSPKSNFSISFEFESQKSELNITFSFNEPCFPSDKILLHLSSDILWKYLYREATINNVYIDALKICITTKVFSPNNTFASQALDAYKTQNLLSKAENQASSQLLHDLKNQLIAYQVSLDMAGNNRTSILKSRFEASQHLDNALVIYHSLETVSNSMVSPKIEAVDIGEFIRQYIAEKLTTFPSNIRLETPKSTGSSIVYTSRSFLKSIFENLTKNSVEAMSDGGEIRIDWLYDKTGEVLLIDIADTGPGLPFEIIDKIKSGKVIDVIAFPVLS